jgi:hypothetical protein
MKSVTIDTVLNGWTVKVGCQTLVFTSKETLLKDLSEYLSDPESKTKRFAARCVNRKVFKGQIEQSTTIVSGVGRLTNNGTVLIDRMLGVK